jgi:hypothetical protein
VETNARVVRLGGRAALASGVVFLITIAYTFGFLFARGLSTDMLNAPSRLLPWVNANTLAYVGLWWIFVIHLLLLLPVPAALAVIAGAQRANVRAATNAGVAGAVVGMIASMIIAATAPALGRAAVSMPAGNLPSVLLISELAGSLGLHLRLLSYLLLAVWLATTGVTLLNRKGWRALAVAQLAVSALTVVVVVAKPFDWLDLEPSLGFVFALVYLWIGVALLHASRPSDAGVQGGHTATA